MPRLPKKGISLGKYGNLDSSARIIDPVDQNFKKTAIKIWDSEVVTNYGWRLIAQ